MSRVRSLIVSFNYIILNYLRLIYALLTSLLTTILLFLVLGFIIIINDDLNQVQSFQINYLSGIVMN